ncbi:MAG TPA: hypothetical protein VFN07_09295 [Trueperaceae bacterium]|nr:hypothetical protein [Trueperaceae bacterium]
MPHSVIDETSLLAFCEQHGLPTTLLGTTLFGRGIHAIDLPGPADAPPIVITSGSHATEPAGIIAALTLAATLRVERRVVILPIRDPLGWEGYASYLSLAAGRQITLAPTTDLAALLAELGTVLYQEDGLTIVQVGEIAFLSKPPVTGGRGPMDIWKHLHGVLDADPDVVRTLQNRRLVLPENLPDVEGCGVYDHAFTAWVTAEGGVGNFNRLFSLPDPPTEVRLLADLVRELRPELVIDMHESQGGKFSIFAHPDLRPGATEVYFGATGAVYAAGHELEALVDLIPIIGADHAAKFVDRGGGVLTGLNEFPGQGWQFTHLCAELGAVTVTTETGRWQPLASRVEQQVLAARGAIFAYLHAVGAQRA